MEELKICYTKLETNFTTLSNCSIRDIAQLGRAPALGAGSRRFKSYYPEGISNNCIDQFNKN